MKTKIYIVRSVECEGNTKEILGESQNYEFTEKGKAMIKSLNKYFKDKKIAKIYSSDSEMAIGTIKEFAESENLEIVKDSNLREKYFGEYDGKTWKEILEISPELKKFRKKKIEILGIKNQESTKEVEDRMWKSIADIAKSNLSQTVLIVSHGVAIETILRAIVSVPYSDDKEKYFQKNGAINYIEYDEVVDAFIVKKVGEII